MRNPRQTWIVGTVIISLLMCVAAWFLVITPKRESAAELNTQADTLKQENAVLTTKVKKLADQFTRIEDFRAELAALQVRLPIDGAVPSLVDQLDGLATEADVNVASILVSDAQSVTAASGEKKKELDSLDATVRGKTEEAEGEKPAEGETATEGEKPAEGEKAADSTKAATPATGKAATAAEEVLVSFPTTVSFTGSFAEASTYLRSLQEALPRYFLVSGIEASSLASGETDTGEKVEDGDVEFILTGAFFLYTDSKTKLAADYADPYELPASGGNANPFRRDLNVAEDK